MEYSFPRTGNRLAAVVRTIRTGVQDRMKPVKISLMLLAAVLYLSAVPAMVVYADEEPAPADVQPVEQQGQAAPLVQEQQAVAEPQPEQQPEPQPDPPPVVQEQPVEPPPPQQEQVEQPAENIQEQPPQQEQSVVEQAPEQPVEQQADPGVQTPP